MEKEHQPDSMATITMKPEYPPSEVYSTSEPPPAYRQRASNSVQIARIAAVTVVAASCILGAFLLASSWVAARASCHQLEQLDAMLDKELALENKSYGADAFMPEEPLPLGSAHALQGTPPPPANTPPPAPRRDDLHRAETTIDEDKLQKLDGDKKSSDSSESSEADSSEEEEQFQLPIHLDLDDLAGAFLANSQHKGRMNCVVERGREARGFPFSLLGELAPRAERLAVICSAGPDDQPGRLRFPAGAAQVFALPRAAVSPAPPAPRAPLPPAAAAFLHMQHRAQPFPLPLPWESSEEQGSGPREMRIHVQRVLAVPAPDDLPYPPPQRTNQPNEQATVMHQFVPQPAPTQELEQPEVQKMQLGGGAMGWGLGEHEPRPVDLDNDMQEVKTIVNTLAAAAEAEAAAAEAERAEQQAAQHEQQAEQRAAQQAEQRAAQLAEPRAEPRDARTLLLPQEMPSEDRPHYMQPRSVRSVDALTGRAKRVQRCACSCR